jgi:hypothetical protein
MPDKKQDEKTEEVKLEDLPVEEAREEEVKGGPGAVFFVDVSG